MAASNASKISKALSKIVSPSVGSPKKSIRAITSPKAQSTTSTVFKKPTGVPKLLVYKSVKEVKTEEPERLVFNTIKKVKATLDVPTPTRRPPSIPLSPWNADTVIRASKTAADGGGAKKKKVTTPKPKVNKSAGSKKNTSSNITEKSHSSNPAKLICKNGQKTPTVRTVPAKDLAKSKITGRMKTSTSVKSVKPIAVIEPFSPSTESSSAQNDTAPSASSSTQNDTAPTASSSTQNDTAPSASSSTQNETTPSVYETIAALQGELDVLNDQVASICQIKAFNIPFFGEYNEEIEKNSCSVKTQLMSENLGKAITPPKYSIKNTNAYLNTSYIANNYNKINSPHKFEAISDINYLQMNTRMQNTLSPFTKASSVDKLNNTVVPETDERSPRVRQSLDGISSPRISLQGDGDKPWSPFGQPSPRVFERQYVDLADNLFSPYITDDENASAMRSPRHSL